jgi:hypothetical protein
MEAFDSSDSKLVKKGYRLVTQIRMNIEGKKPYESPKLQEYGDLGVLTLGGNGASMDNGTGGGMAATKA